MGISHQRQTIISHIVEKNKQIHDIKSSTCTNDSQYLYLVIAHEVLNYTGFIGDRPI